MLGGLCGGRRRVGSRLSPDLEEGVPGAGAEGSAVGVDAEAGDAVVVALEEEDLLSLEGVPDDAVVVVVAGEEEAAGDGEGDGGDTDEDLVRVVGHELAVSAEVPETAGRVICTSGEAEAVGHNLGRG